LLPGAQPEILAAVAGRSDQDGVSTVPLADLAGEVRVRTFTLRVVEGPDAGRDYGSAGDRTIIGTHESAELILRDPTVSRFHCEILAQDRSVLIRDLGSRNGVHVNDLRVREAYLRSGVTITVGQTRILFEIGAESLPMPISDRERFGLLVGRSLAARRMFALLERAAQSGATVLLQGETGTGKEAAAESIHGESERRGRPFVVVDCASIPPDLVESELFGHERGAFTGAVSAREGAFEAADGGTIFLDEIGELGADLQPKLLRVLERREIKRVGSTRYLPVNVRVIAATNRDLRAEVNSRRFRSDLYYRLAVIEITMPPLRERVEDLHLLVEHLLKLSGLVDRPEAELVRRPHILSAMAKHPWPGNVRELRNYVERCVALAQYPPLRGDAAPAAGAPVVDIGQPLRKARDEWLAAFEREYLTQILARHEGNVRLAAEAAGIDRIYFYRLLWKHGLK
jgi:DNA-binding NtrC family response regulator